MQIVTALPPSPSLWRMLRPCSTGSRPEACRTGCAPRNDTISESLPAEPTSSTSTNMSMSANLPPEGGTTNDGRRRPNCPPSPRPGRNSTLSGRAELSRIKVNWGGTKQEYGDGGGGQASTSISMSAWEPNSSGRPPSPERYSETNKAPPTVQLSWRARGLFNLKRLGGIKPN